MKYQLIVEHRALSQLREAARWYEAQSQSREVADRWYSGFLRSIETLRDDPLSFPLARESHRFPYELREMLYGSGRKKTHRALFRVQDERVEVMLIRHAAQRDVDPADI